MRKKAPFTIDIVPGEVENTGAPNFLQSGFWAAFKGAFGWEARGFRVLCSGEDGHRIEIPLSVLIRDLPGGFTLAYVPHGPDPGAELPGDPCDCLEYLSRSLKSHLPKSCLFIRYDVPWGSRGEDNFPKPLCRPLRRAPLDIQPPDTVILSLEGDDEVLLGAMKPKTRYNIRLAEKKGVLVRCGTVEELSLWYELYRETAERDGIGLHEYGYYRRLFDLAETYSGKKPLLRLLLATAEEKLLAGIIVAVFDEHAFYLYGASSNEMRNYMASYLLQWRAMVLAKSLGARDYDLFGIPPRDDPGHAMYGLFRFKTGFGGTFLHRPGSYDFPFKYFAYLGYRGAEGIRKWYHKSWAKRLVKRRF